MTRTGDQFVAQRDSPLAGKLGGAARSSGAGDSVLISRAGDSAALFSGAEGSVLISGSGDSAALFSGSENSVLSSRSDDSDRRSKSEDSILASESRDSGLPPEPRTRALFSDSAERFLFSESRNFFQLPAKKLAAGSGAGCGTKPGKQSRSRVLIPLLVLVFLLPFSIAKADPYIDAELAPRSVAPGEITQYTLTISNADGAEIDFPPFGDLKVVSGPSQSIQSVMQFSSGRPRVQSTRVYRWILEAPREGTFLIGQASMVFKGQKFRSKALELKVSESQGMAQWEEPDFDQDWDSPANQGSRQRRGQGRSGAQRRSNHPFGSGFDPFEELLDDPFARMFEDITAPPKQSDLFLRASADKKEVYLGEQLSLSLHLFSQADISGVQALSFPKLDGFWSEDIESPTQLYPQQQNIRGRSYRSYMLRKRALFPLRAGEITIDPVEAQVNLALAVFFGAQTETVKRRSAPVTVRVKSLPAEGQPPGFEASNVGSYRLLMEPLPQRIELGQPLEIKVKIEGVGNIRNLKPPVLKLPDGLRAYAPKVSDEVKIVKGRYGGSKTLEWVVLPERTGTFDLPALEFAYFDPQRAEYQSARSKTQQIEVFAPSRPLAAQDHGQARSESAVANLLPTGLRPIRVEASLRSRQLEPVWHKSWFWPWTAAPLLILAFVGLVQGLAGVSKQRLPAKKDPKRARALAEGRLKKVSEQLRRSDGLEEHAAELYSEVARTLIDFLHLRCEPGAQGLGREALLNRLEARDFPPAAIRGLRRVLERCDLARFAPDAGSADKLEEVLKEASWVVSSLDEAAAGKRSAS